MAQMFNRTGRALLFPAIQHHTMLAYRLSKHPRP